MSEFTIVIEAGNHDRANCPVWVPLGPAAAFDGSPVLLDQAGRPVPCQVRPGPSPSLCVLIRRLSRGAAATFTLREAPERRVRQAVALRETPGSHVDIVVSGEPFTRYHHAERWARPFLMPLIGPYGESVTRQYPVAVVPGETQDHPHHKSCWVAWGDVNGTDNWSEEEGHGRQVHRGFTALTGGPVFGCLGARNDWLANDGRKLLEEERTLTVYATPTSARLADLSVRFAATESQVRFGDTKEGGLVSVRVATSMDAKGAGCIVNSYGGVSERETWGKRAHWCDYSGPVNGHTVGIAVFDTPTNLRYPTYWHVRDYGLMTANPFGLSHFHGDPAHIGSHTLRRGEVLEFRYRILIHAGDARAAGVAARFLDYVAPPAARIEARN